MKKLFLIFSLLFVGSLISSCSVNEKNPYNGHDYVDLGLPSGLKWATCNVGAVNPEDYGLYFAWGETKGYDRNSMEAHSFDWSCYKWADGDYKKLTKYNSDSRFGNFLDTLTVLQLSDDAAHVNWGGKWRMPTENEIEELIANCFWTVVVQNGVRGFLVSSRWNRNSIFLPGAGLASSKKLSIDDKFTHYWSSTLSAENSYEAAALYKQLDNVPYRFTHRSRDKGMCIRPVFDDRVIETEEHIGYSKDYECSPDDFRDGAKSVTENSTQYFNELDKLPTESSFKIFTVKENTTLYNYYQGNVTKAGKVSAGDTYLTGIGLYSDETVQDYYYFDDMYDIPQPCIKKDKVDCEEFQYTYVPKSILDKYVLIFNDEKGNEAKMMTTRLGSHFPISDYEFYLEDDYNKETGETYIFLTKDAITFGRSVVSVFAEDFDLDAEGNLSKDLTDIHIWDGNNGGGYSLCYIPAKRALFNENTQKFYYLTKVLARSAYQESNHKNTNKEESFSEDIESAIPKDASPRQSNSSSYKPFTNEWDVRSFLTSNTFVSKDGDRINFREQGNQLYYNGTCMSSIIKIGAIKKNSAVFIYKGPYGTAGFSIVNEEWAQSIMEASTRKFFDAE